MHLDQDFGVSPDRVGVASPIKQSASALDHFEIGLSATEAALVRLLVERRGVAMSKEAISAGLSLPNGGQDGRMVDVLVCRTRRKFADAGLDGMIETVWGRGYMARAEGDETAPAPPTSRKLHAALLPA